MAQQSANSISILLSSVNADIARYDGCNDPQVLDHLIFQLELLQQYLLLGNAESDAILLLAQAVSAISMTVRFHTFPMWPLQSTFIPMEGDVQD